MAEKPNGEERTFQKNNTTNDINLLQLFQLFISPILFPSSGNTVPLLHRIKTSLSHNVPLIPEASRNTTNRLRQWSRAGTLFRPLLLISVGAITLVALTGLVVFLLFLLAATINAIIVTLLISLVAAGGFVALFFAFVTVICIGALTVAIFAISTVLFWTTLAIFITTGWIAFFYTVWLVTSKSFGFVKHSLSATGSAISTYSVAWGTRNLPHKASD